MKQFKKEMKGRLRGFIWTMIVAIFSLFCGRWSTECGGIEQGFRLFVTILLIMDIELSCGLELRNEHL